MMRERALAVGTLALIGASPAWADTVTVGIEPIDRTATITVSRAGDGLGAPIILPERPKTIANGASSLPSAMDTPRGLPVAARSLTSRFGMRSHPVLGGRRMHSGIDLAAAAGSPVAAPAAGIVSFANWNGGYGLLVTVEHGNGVQTRFAHLSRLMVSPGQRVERGQLLGLVGSTGRSTGPHLHYEVRQSGRPVDPLAAR
ncbi:M23 family metallopeptidase [Tsuneonella amylolytica]|uniref:M23 family metallopeptidase n=1 Tax=Tsuneonella amylolytica TaxID=2338327 RepID=UPI000EAA5046|nr:M23 family metallopeptidase [Tsuneonella amylolytica]